MFAVVEILGKQFKIQKDDIIFTDRQAEGEGEKIKFDKILLLSNADSQCDIGTPYLKHAHIVCQVEKHLKDKKVIVFKKKRRKGYQVKNGHRQLLTKMKVLDIIYKKPAKS